MKIVDKKETQLVSLFDVGLGNIFKADSNYWMKCDEYGEIVTAVNMESGEITDNFYVSMEVEPVNAELHILD